MGSQKRERLAHIFFLSSMHPIGINCDQQLWTRYHSRHWSYFCNWTAKSSSVLLSWNLHSSGERQIMAIDKYENGKEQKGTMMGRKDEQDAILDRAVRAEHSNWHLSRDPKWDNRPQKTWMCTKDQRKQMSQGRQASREASVPRGFGCY